MTNIFCIMGKSASGKDAIYFKLMKMNITLRPMLMYTTRAMRSGEVNGKNYYFVSKEQYDSYVERDMVLESNMYTMADDVDVYYFMMKEQLAPGNYVVKGPTIPSYQNMRAYYKDANVIPIYIHVPDKVLIERSLMRLDDNDTKGCIEACRRYIADAQVQWSPSNIELLELNDENIFINMDLDETVNNIDTYICKK